ncbi:hypothetical protein [Longispora fulva]|uniref:Uncharacterized protein n=1 Tax=Longispora fulva TaxID=619741 RepID=A0A8J7GDE5_9ACTN|nr:hypothetical protein [Longispora fulva]MBG6138498.1 hypothetical protein [Longispora fulva]
MGKLLLWVTVGIVGLALAGWLALKLIGALLGVLGYLLVGAAIVGGAYYLYTRARRALTSGRTANRIEAAIRTRQAGK